jgi:site-specific DNA-methyltransferase (adenine-specific)/modification methylase
MSKPWSRVEVIGDCTLYLGDCRKIIGELTFDAICADPPYGIGYRHSGGGGRLAKSTVTLKPIIGDDRPFDPVALLDLRVPLILWGGNHFANNLPASQSWLIWDKRCADYSNDQADCEMAWTNLDFPARMFRHVWNGMLRGSESKTPRVHPTQKPVALMEWCLGFLPNAQTILDPFMGSGTTLVACQRMGRNGTGIELDPDYFDIACRRVDEATRQPDLLIAPPKPQPVQEGWDI